MLLLTMRQPFGARRIGGLSLGGQSRQRLLGALLVLAHGAQPFRQLGLGLFEGILEPLESDSLLAHPLDREAEQPLQLIFGNSQLLLMAQPAAQRLTPQGGDLLPALAQTLQRRRGAGLLLTAALLAAAGSDSQPRATVRVVAATQLYLTACPATKALFTAQPQGTELLLQLLQGSPLLLVLAQAALLLGRQGCQLGLRLLMALLQPLALLLIVEELQALLDARVRWPAHHRRAPATHAIRGDQTAPRD